MLWTYFAFPEDERVFFLFSSLTEVKTKSKDPIKILKMKQLANKEPFFPSNWAPSAVRLWGDLFSFGDGRLRCDATVSVWTGGLPALPFSPLPLFIHPLDNACPETTVCQLGTWDNAHMHTQDTTSQPRTSEDTHIGHMIISSLQNVKCSTHTHTNNVTSKSQDTRGLAKPAQCAQRVPKCVVCELTPLQGLQFSGVPLCGQLQQFGQSLWQQKKEMTQCHSQDGARKEALNNNVRVSCN